LWLFDHVEKLSEKALNVILIENLPLLLHRDPFDRMLIASAISDGMRFITADTNIQKYNISWVW